MIDGVYHKVKAGDGVVVPARAHHNVICTGNHALMILLNFSWSAPIVLGTILAIELISNGVLLVAISLLAKSEKK